MKFVKITDNNAKAVTEIELAYGNSIQDFFIVTGVDCTAFNNTFVVKSVSDCIRRALDWKYSVNDFSTDSPDKDGRHVYVNGREIDAFSSVARQIAYKGYNEREYKEHIDMVNADYAISLLNTSKLMTLKGLKEMEGELKAHDTNPYGDSRYATTMRTLSIMHEQKVSEAIISLASKGAGYKALRHIADTCHGNLVDAVEYMTDIELSRACECPDADMQEFAYKCFTELTKRRKATLKFEKAPKIS